MALNLHRNQKEAQTATKKKKKKKQKLRREQNKTLNRKSHKHTGNIFIITEQTKNKQKKSILVKAREEEANKIY